jgi:hypothetical protein
MGSVAFLLLEKIAVPGPVPKRKPSPAIFDQSHEAAPILEYGATSASSPGQTHSIDLRTDKLRFRSSIAEEALPMFEVRPSKLSRRKHNANFCPTHPAVA